MGGESSLRIQDSSDRIEGRVPSPGGLEESADATSVVDDVTRRVSLARPAWHGVATSSSPLESHRRGDEDIAAPDEVIIRRVPPRGAVFKIGSSHLRLPPPRRDQARATNPNGILAPSPGLPSLRGYPGSPLDWVPTAKRLWPFRLGNVVVRDRIEEATTALRLAVFGTVTQGSLASSATCKPQRLWRCREI